MCQMIYTKLNSQINQKRARGNINLIGWQIITLIRLQLSFSPPFTFIIHFTIIRIFIVIILAIDWVFFSVYSHQVPAPTNTRINYF